MLWAVGTFGVDLPSISPPNNQMRNRFVTSPLWQSRAVQADGDTLGGSAGSALTKMRPVRHRHRLRVRKSQAVRRSPPRPTTLTIRQLTITTTTCLPVETSSLGLVIRHPLLPPSTWGKESDKRSRRCGEMRSKRGFVSAPSSSSGVAPG